MTFSQAIGTFHNATSEECVLIVYRFDTAPVALRDRFGATVNASWLAHVNASVAGFIDQLLANWAMTWQIKDRRALPDGSVVLVGEFDVFGARPNQIDAR